MAQGNVQVPSPPRFACRFSHFGERITGIRLVMSSGLLGMPGRRGSHLLRWVRRRLAKLTLSQK